MDLRKSTVKFILLPIVVITLCSLLLVYLMFREKYTDSLSNPADISIEEKSESFMSILKTLYDDVAMGDVVKFQDHMYSARAIPSWVLSGSDSKKELTVLASSEYPDLIGKPLPLDVCGIDVKRYYELINKGYYKSIELVPDNKAMVCYFKKHDDVIIGYNMLHNIKISGFDDPYFKDWFIVNMRNTIIATTSMMVIAFFQYILFFARLKSDQMTLVNINSELISKNNDIERQLYFDPLTGLPNKASLQKDIELMKKPKIVIIDIDDFRKMNNYFGVLICNQILIHLAGLADRIGKKEGMKAYRVGADQFAFVEDGDIFIDRYEELAVDLLDEIKGIVVEVQRDKSDRQDPIEIHCSIGFSLDEDDTFKKAMLALEYAKNNNRDYVCYFKNLDDTAKYAEQIKRSNLIRDAIVNDKIIPYYQPIVDSNKQILKYETLVRIQSSHEIMPPHIFLDVSKRIKRYVDIEKMLLEKSFKLISDKPNITISINLSGRDMMDGDMSVFIIDKIKKYDIANRIIFEIIEDENIENVERVIRFIERVKRMGVRIAIDDFGSGYSNFSYMLQLKPDYIKIDGSIIKNIDKDSNSRSVASAIIAFAKKLNISVIAEYVHSKEVFETCVLLGVDEFQGYYLGEPSQTIQ